MKGMSAVIATILMMSITVAMAILAYQALTGGFPFTSHALIETSEKDTWTESYYQKNENWSCLEWKNETKVTSWTATYPLGRYEICLQESGYYDARSSYFQNDTIRTACQNIAGHYTSTQVDYCVREGLNCHEDKYYNDYNQNKCGLPVMRPLEYPDYCFDSIDYVTVCEQEREA